MASGFSSSLSGLSASFFNQDVTANNVSNQNTPGFKSRRAEQSSVEAGGTQIDNVSVDTSQGPLMRTGRSRDVAIEGDGFFPVQRDGETVFTRAGSFDVDAEGNLVNTITGGIAEGFEPGNSGGDPDPIRITRDERTLDPAATDRISFSGNLSSNLAVGDSRDVSVDLTDSQGRSRSVTLSFEKTATNTFKFTAQDPETSTTALRGTLSFDARGRVDSVDVQVSPNAPGTFEGLFFSGQGADPIKIPESNLDFSTVTQQASATTLGVGDVNGHGPGQLSDVSVAEDGTVRGTFSNGERKSLGQLALASFDNPSGLEARGDSAFTPTANSGTPRTGAPGTGDRGRLRQGVLEASNVELSDQMIQMVINQNSTGANVDALRVRDEMMGSLLDLTG